MKTTRRQTLLMLGGAIGGSVPGLSIFPGRAQEAQVSVDELLLPRRWDESVGLVLSRGGGPGYATRTTGAMMVHPTRESATYAVALADYGHPQAAERINRIVRRLADEQDTNPFSLTFGTWSWYVEEPLSEMRPPDLNWSNFIGARLCELLWDYEALLEPDTREKAKFALLNACASIMRRNVGMDYTNIAVMAIRVTGMAGQLLNNPDLTNYAAAQMQRFAAYTREQGGLTEYNSPVYTVTALLEFEAIVHYLTDEKFHRDASALLRQTWETIAFHFHAPTEQWAGPHSRAYTDLLATESWPMVEDRVGLNVPARQKGLQRPPQYTIPCPDDLRVYFTDAAPFPRTVRERFRRFPDGDELWGTTWLTPEACLGSASIAMCWAQAHPVIGYWKGAPKPVVFRARVMKDKFDFASFGMRATQNEGRVLIGAYPLVDSGDRFPNMFRSKDGYEGNELKFRFTVQGAGAQALRVADDRIELSAQGWKAVVSTGPCRYDGRDISSQWTARTEGDLAIAEVVVPINGRIKPEELKDTLFAAAVSIVPSAQAVDAPPVVVGEAHGSRVASKSLTWGDLRLVSPVVPVPR